MSLSLITLELVLRNILLNDSWLLGLLVPKPPHTPCMQRTHVLCLLSPSESSSSPILPCLPALWKREGVFAIPLLVIRD